MRAGAARWSTLGSRGCGRARRGRLDGQRSPGRMTVMATKLLIGGNWCEARSGETFETVNPATGEVHGHAAAGDAADVDEAVAAARRAYEDPAWRDMSP